MSVSFSGGYNPISSSAISNSSKVSGQPNKYKLLALEKFDDATNWEFLSNDGTATTAWTVSGNKLVSSAGALAKDAIAWYKGAKFADGRIQVQIEDPSIGSYIGVAFRGKTKSDFLVVYINKVGNKIDLYKCVGGVYTALTGSAVLSGLDVALSSGVPVSFDLEITGHQLKVFLNGRNVFFTGNAEMQGYGYGHVGLLVDKNFTAGSFSSFSIQEKRYDVIPPTINKVLCIGTSITFGTGQTVRWVDTLATLLTQNFSTNTVTTINAGVGGNGSANMLARTASLLSTHNPDVVLIETSINDSRIDTTIVTPVQAMDSLRKIIKQVKSSGAIPVLMTSTPIDPSVATTTYDITSFRKIYQMNLLARELAAQENIRLVDNFNVFSNNYTLLDADKVHPNDAGARVIENNILNTIIGNI